MADMIVEYKVMPDTESEVEYEQFEKVVSETVSNYDEKVIIKEWDEFYGYKWKDKWINNHRKNNNL